MPAAKTRFQKFALWFFSITLALLVVALLIPKKRHRFAASSAESVKSPITLTTMQRLADSLYWRGSYFSGTYDTLTNDYLLSIKLPSRAKDIDVISTHISELKELVDSSFQKSDLIKTVSVHTWQLDVDSSRIKPEKHHHWMQYNKYDESEMSPRTLMYTRMNKNSSKKLLRTKIAQWTPQTLRPYCDSLWIDTKYLNQ